MDGQTDGLGTSHGGSGDRATTPEGAPGCSWTRGCSQRPRGRGVPGHFHPHFLRRLQQGPSRVQKPACPAACPPCCCTPIPRREAPFLACGFCWGPHPTAPPPSHCLGTPEQDRLRNRCNKDRRARAGPSVRSTPAPGVMSLLFDLFCVCLRCGPGPGHRVWTEAQLGDCMEVGVSGHLTALSSRHAACSLHG